MRTRALWLVPLVVIATATASAAPSASSSAAGQALFEDGRALMEQKKWAEAIDKFQRTHELVPSVGALINIGDCYSALDKPASAWGAYHEAENLAARLKDPRAATAQQRATNLGPLARLTVTVPKIDGLVVTRNGTKVDPATLDTAVPVDHGSYTVEATAPGRRPWSGKVDVERGKSAKIAIPDLEVVPTGEVAPPPPATDDGQTQRTVALGLEIGGGALLLGGLVFGALTMTSWSSAEKQCPDGICPSEAAKDENQSAADRASTFGLLSTVGVIAGVGVLAGGIVLHLTAPKKQSVALAPVMGQGMYGVSFTFRP